MSTWSEGLEFSFFGLRSLKCPISKSNLLRVGTNLSPRLLEALLFLKEEEREERGEEYGEERLVDGVLFILEEGE